MVCLVNDDEREVIALEVVESGSNALYEPDDNSLALVVFITTLGSNGLAGDAPKVITSVLKKLFEVGKD